MGTSYLGMELRSPLVASAGPLTRNAGQVEALADTGLGAIVLHSLFEEQVRAQARQDELLNELTSDAFSEASSYFPTIDEPDVPARTYLNLVERSAAAVDIPVIASLNGANMGGWVEFARQLADAGAAALECNIYFVPGDVRLSGTEVEKRHLEITAAVKAAVDIPVAVKLSPYFSSIGNLALQVVDAGADGLVMFNRFLAPSVDTQRLEVVPGVTLSTPADARLPRTWIAILRHYTTASLAATSGVENSDDVAAHLLAGADVVMTTSSLVRHGVTHARDLLAGLAEWERQFGFSDPSDYRGRLAVPADADGASGARQGYVAALEKARATYGSLI